MTLFSLPQTVDPRPVQRWLYLVAGMIFVMVVIGGLTRLTESGLSMTDWRPVLGWLPPMSQEAWMAEFERYRQTPQFRDVFPTLSLEGFKEIYWLEYTHRLFGRLIGIVFFLPFLWFWATGQISRRMFPHLVALFVLGGLQGALGWFMVQSGLVDRPSVSQYRLAAHLGFALALYGYIVWFAWGLTMPRRSDMAPKHLMRWANLLLILLAITVVAGAFVAGLDAGRIHNTFPTMAGRLVPPDYWQAELGVLNLFENRVTVQFNHRLLATVTGAAVIAYWFVAMNDRTPRPGQRFAASLALAAVALQYLLGVYTLLAFVPVWLGTLHQAGAVLLLTAVLWMVHRLRWGGESERVFAAIP